MREIHQAEVTTRRRPRIDVPRIRGKGSAMSTLGFKHICLRDVGGIVVIEMITNDIQGPDLAREFIDELMLAVEREDSKPILMNLRRAIHFSSMGYAALFKLVKRAKELRRPIRFCEIHPDVRVGSDLIGLPLVVAIDETEESALQAFAAA
jgi:anti-anti-sigma regulatory factor